jgi:hypothetical protein
VTKIDLIQVQEKDLLFRQVLFDPIGKYSLFEFATKTSLWAQQQRFSNLLGYGASTLDNATSLDVFPRGAKYTQEIDPLVFKKPRIFCGNKGINQSLRNLFQRNNYSALQIKLSDEVATIVIYSGDYRRLIVLESTDLGKIPSNAVKPVRAPHEKDDYDYQRGPGNKANFSSLALSSRLLQSSKMGSQSLYL